MTDRLTVGLVLGSIAGCLLGSATLPYRIIDHRATDGSVLLVKKVRRDNPGQDPFVSAKLWELTPATHYFRLEGVRVPARVPTGSFDPPKVIVSETESRAGVMTEVLGASIHIEPGEPVRLVDVNAALGNIWVDVETICRRDHRGHAYRGRISFDFEGQVTRSSLDAANRVVGRNLRPIPLHEVAEHCDPHDGTPPVLLRPGLPVPEDRLGHPRSRDLEGDEEIWDYGSIVLRVKDGAMLSIGIPALD